MCTESQKIPLHHLFPRVKTDAEPPAGLCSPSVYFTMFQCTTSRMPLPKFRESKRQNCQHDGAFECPKSRQHHRQGLPVLCGDSQNRTKLEMSHQRVMQKARALKERPSDAGKLFYTRLLYVAFVTHHGAQATHNMIFLCL